MATFSEESHPTSTSESQLEDSLSETDLSQQEQTSESPSDGDQGTEQQAKEELQIFQDKYVRLAAEFENYKRRAQRDQSDAIRYANESLLKNLLSTIDNLERAIQSGKDAGATGATMHQAVAQVESDTTEPNTVIEEFQKGYFLHDRILRPAMVTVAKEKSDQTEPSSTKDTGE
jgi:molecular chaperone GrpE